MSSPAKYMFDTAFGAPATPPPVAFDEVEALRRRHTDELTAARDEALRQGREEGRQEALATIENELLQCLERIVAGQGDVERHIDGRLDEIRDGALRLALTAADKFAAGLIAREPAAQVETFFATCLSMLPSDIALQLFVAPHLAPLLEERLAMLLARSGHTNELRIFADDTVDGTDCRLLWTEGGIEQSQARMKEQIETLLAAYLAAADGTTNHPETRK